MQEQLEGRKASPDELAQSLSARIQHPSLSPLGAAFAESIDNLEFLRITPQVLLSHGYAEAASFNFFSKLAKTDDIKGYSGFEDWFDQYRKRVESVAATEEARKQFMDHLWETAQRHLVHLSHDKKVASALRSIEVARVVLGWTAFECLAADSWETALNESALRLGQRALSAIPDDASVEDGLTRKHVAVGLLAKYGFDLRKKLGTILRQKFDFSSLAGIRRLTQRYSVRSRS